MRAQRRPVVLRRDDAVGAGIGLHQHRGDVCRAERVDALEYRSGAGSWVELGSVTGQRATPVDQRFPLAPSSATQIRWRGPCPGQPAAACTLAESP